MWPSPWPLGPHALPCMKFIYSRFNRYMSVCGLSLLYLLEELLYILTLPAQKAIDFVDRSTHGSLK